MSVARTAITDDYAANHCLKVMTATSAAASARSRPNSSRHKFDEITLLFLCLIISLCSLPFSTHCLHLSDWPNPEFQLLVDGNSGCSPRSIFDDPSDSSAIVAWCEPVISAQRWNNLSRIQVNAKTQEVTVTMLWSPELPFSPDVVISANGTIWSYTMTGISRLVPSKTSTAYDEFPVFNMTDGTEVFGLEVLLATDDVFFLVANDVTNQVWKLPNGLPPAAPVTTLSEYSPFSLQIHQSSQTMFMVCNDSTILVYSIATGYVDVYGIVPADLGVGIVQLLLPSPDASVVWLGCNRLMHYVQPEGPILVAMRKNSLHVDVLVSEADCQGAASLDLRFDVSSSRLYFLCGYRVLCLQMNSFYQVMSARFITDTRCSSVNAPVRLHSMLVIPCVNGQLLGTQGNSVVEVISPIDCVSPTLVSALPSSLGQTVLLFICIGYPAVFVNGKSSVLAQLSMDHNGVGHLSHSDLIYSSCNYVDRQNQPQTQLRALDLRTNQVRSLAECPSGFSRNLILSPPFVVNQQAVIYQCQDSVWRLGLGSTPTALPAILLNFTSTDPITNRTVVSSVTFMRAIDSSVIVMASSDVGDEDNILYYFRDDLLVRKFDTGNCTPGQIEALDESVVLYACTSSQPGYFELVELNVATDDSVIVWQSENQLMNFAVDTRINGTRLKTVWPNATHFFVMDDSNMLITWHAFPDGCIDSRALSFVFMVFHANSIILSCASWTTSTSLFVTSLANLINPDVTQPFVPLLRRSYSVCSGRPIEQLMNSVIDNEIFYLSCLDSLLAFTTDFRCFPGQEFVAGSCSPCGPATFKPEAAYNASMFLMDKCAPCPPGSVTPNIGSFSCTVCELGSVADSLNLTCQVCPRGMHTPTLASACVSCEGSNQVGLSCANGLASIDEGYFAYLPSDNLASGFRTAVCPRGFCPGGPLQLQTINGVSVDGTIQYCSSPRRNSPTNLLCGACDSSLGYVVWGTSCVECPGIDVPMMLAQFAFAVVVVVWLFISSASRNSTTSGHVALLLYFVQTAIIQLDPVPEWIQFMHLVNLNVGSVGRCMAPLSPIQQTVFSWTTPLILLGILACLGAIQYLSHYCSARRAPGLDVAALRKFSQPLTHEENKHQEELLSIRNEIDPFSNDVMLSSSFAVRWGPLFRGYSVSSAYSWTSIVLLRRALLAVISIYLANPAQFAYRQVAFILIHFASFHLHIQMQPYSTSLLNLIEAISYSLLLILGCIQVIGGATQPPLWMQICVVAIVLIPSVVMIVWIGFIQFSNRNPTTRAYDPSGAQAGAEDKPTASLLSRLWASFRAYFDINRYVAGAVSVLLFSYTGVVQTAFAFLRCVPVGSASIVFSSPAIDCNSTAYFYASIAAILVLVLFGFGLPTASLILLTRNRGRIMDSEAVIRN